MTTTLIDVETEKLRLLPGNIRQAPLAEVIQGLADSMVIHGQLVPILINMNFEILDGQQRWLALKLAKIAKATCIQSDEALTEAQVREIQWVSFYHRADISPFEQYQAMLGIAKAHPDWSNIQIAKHLAVNPPEMTRTLSASHLIPEAFEAFKAGTISKKAAYQISQVKEEDQPGRLAMFLAGSTCEEVELKGKSEKKATTPTVRTDKLKCQLPGGPMVMVAGQEITLDDCIDATKHALKLMVKARDQGLDSRTAQAVWRDMAAV